MTTYTREFLFLSVILWVNSSIAQMSCYDIFTKKEHTFINQETDYFCGPAVLQSTLAANGIYVNQAELARLAKTTQELGTSPENMARTIAQFGLVAEVKRLSGLDELKEVLRKVGTVIALVKSEGEAHWVIIDGEAGSGFKLMDPWTDFKENREVSEHYLLLNWTTIFDQTSLEKLAIVVSRETK